MTVTPSSAGTITVAGWFSDAAQFFADASGALPPVATTATTTLTVVRAMTFLNRITAPSTAFVGAALTVSAGLFFSDSNQPVDRSG